jgi:hypothetical protein
MTTSVNSAETGLTAEGVEFIQRRTLEYRDEYGPDAALFYRYVGEEVGRARTEPDLQELSEVTTVIEGLLSTPLNKRDDSHAQSLGTANLQRDAVREGSHLTLLEFVAATMNYEDDIGFSQAERIHALGKMIGLVLKRTHMDSALLADNVRVTRDLRSAFEVSLGHSFSRRCRAQAAQDWAQLEQPVSTKVLARQLVAADN